MSVRVPFPAKLDRRPLAEDNGHRWYAGADRKPDRATGGRGRWRFTLETVTPLCIRTLYDDLARAGKGAFVPGSSLRGMFRNMVQVIGAGCALEFGNESIPGKRFMEPCGTASGLCIACRLFGTVRRDGFAWMGKVRIHDSEANLVEWERCAPDGVRDGRAPQAEAWILFRDTDDELPNEVQRGGLVCAPVGVQFGFDVEYADLDAEELAVLQFAITMRHRGAAMYHKLGFGKALGLGTVDVRRTDERAVAEDAMDRYATAQAIWQVLLDNR